MKQRIPTLDEYINESVIKEQIPFILDLKPGDVIYATADYTHNDIDYARMAKNFIGKITQLNSRNMSKPEPNSSLNPDRIDWAVAKKGEVKAVVLANGELSFQAGLSCNIKNIGNHDYVLVGFNILFTDKKIAVRPYNKKNEDERFLVFKANLYYGGGYFKGDKDVTIENQDVEFNTDMNASYEYNKKDNVLIVKNGFSIKTGEGGKVLKIKDASSNDDIKRGGKSLNDY